MADWDPGHSGTRGGSGRRPGAGRAPRPPDAPGEVELTGTVARVRFQNAETHWTVAALAVDGARRSTAPTTIVGELPGLAEDMRVRVVGRWVDDARYGRQLRVARYEERVPATAEGLAAYLASGFIKGIGETMARRIVDRFGPATLEVIRESPGRLREVEGLGAKRVDRIAKAVKERRGAQEALVFLHGIGLTPAYASRVFKRYGDDTVRLVRRNPYRLAEDVHGIGFRKADVVARSLSIDHDHPARIRAGAFHVLLEARGEGHVCLDRPTLQAYAAELLGVGEDAVDQGIESLAVDGKVVLSPHPDVARPSPADDLVYLTSLHEAETETARRLGELVRAPAPPPDAAERVAAAEHALGFELAPAQKDAVAAALAGGVVVITGGPGTGKTTLVRAILHASGLEPHQIALAAPTGRAAKRLSEATGHEGKTLHRLLEFSPADVGFGRDEDTPLEHALVLVDEASMMDLPLAYALVRALTSQSTLVLVGDVDQLPPVGPGAPLTDLMTSDLVPVVRLGRVFRQGEGSAIVDIAHRIQQGEVPGPTPPGTPLQDFYFVHREAPEAILATLETLVGGRIPERFGLDPIRDVQVLAPMRSGILGVEALNARLQALLNPHGEALEVGRAVFRVGDKVMQIRNDYERDVYNGDVGVVIRLERGKEPKVVVAVDERPVVYDKSHFDDLVLAYAVSVHKSQGSEYPAVVMPVSTQHFKMLQRNLVYTGITRGRRLVVLVGTPRAMSLAVRNREVARRASFLDRRLAAATPPR